MIINFDPFIDDIADDDPDYDNDDIPIGIEI